MFTFAKVNHVGRDSSTPNFANVNHEASTLEFVSKKPLGDERAEGVRKFLRKLIAERFDGNQDATAKALDVSPGYVSELLASKRNAGNKLIDGLRALTGASYEDIYGGAALPPPRPTRGADHLRDLAEWSVLLPAAKALRQDRGYAPWVWEQLGEVNEMRVIPHTPTTLAELADMVAKHVTPPLPPAKKKRAKR